MARGDAKPEIPGYEIGDLLGQGGGGAVYRAQQVGLDRPVALKVLNRTSDGTDAQARRRFIREAKILSQLEHPHLVKVYDFGGADDVPWIAMELFEGGTLADHLQSRPVSREGALTPDEVTSLAREILSAMVVLHRARVVHRDVKPSNILYRDTGEAVLGDFGIVKILSPEATQMTGTLDLVGTMLYLPPEAYKTSSIGPPADIFSFGVVLFEALTGVHPSQGTPFGAGFKPPSIRSLCPSCPPELEQLLQEMLDCDPAERPTAHQAVARLDTPESAAAAGRPAPTIVAPVRPALSPLRVAAGAALLVGALVAGFLLAWRPAPPPAVEVEVDASARSLRATIAAQSIPHQLALFDGSGQLMSTLRGTAEGTRVAFEHDGLDPGTSYELRVLRMPPSGEGGALGETVGHRTFRTRSLLEVLAIESTASGPRLWAKGLPSLWAMGAGDSAGVTLSGEPVAIPLGGVVPDGPESRALLRLVDGSGARTEVELRWEGGTPPSPAPRLDTLGVVIDDSTEPAMGIERLEDWLLTSGVGWVASVAPSSESTPVLAPELFHELQRKAGIRTLLDVRTEMHPDDATWETRFLALPWSKGSEPVLTSVNLSERLLGRAGRQMQARNEVQVWMQHVEKRHPGISFLTPPALALSVLQRFGGGRRIARQMAGQLHSIVIPSSAPAERWKQLSEVVARFAADDDAKAGVEWLWLVDLARAVDIPASVPLSEAYLLARSIFPDARMLVSLEMAIDPADGKTQPSWARLAHTVRRLEGTRATGTLAREAPAIPRLEAPDSVTGVTFTGKGRRIHVVHSPEGAKQARFVPDRPVRISVAVPAADGPDYLDVVAAAPVAVSLDLSGGAAFLEELTEVTARGESSVLELAHPFEAPAPSRSMRIQGRTEP